MFSATAENNLRKEYAPSQVPQPGNFPAPPQNYPASLPTQPRVADFVPITPQFILVPSTPGNFRPSLCYVPMLVFNQQEPSTGLHQVNAQASSVGAPEPHPAGQPTSNHAYQPQNFYLITLPRNAELGDQPQGPSNHILYYPPNQGPVMMRHALPSPPGFPARHPNLSSGGRVSPKDQLRHLSMTPPPLPLPPNCSHISEPSVPADHKDKTFSFEEPASNFQGRVSRADSPKVPSDPEIKQFLNTTNFKISCQNKTEYSTPVGFQFIKRENTKSDSTEERPIKKHPEILLPRVTLRGTQSEEIFIDQNSDHRLMTSQDSLPSAPKHSPMTDEEQDPPHHSAQVLPSKSAEATFYLKTATKHFRDLMDPPEIWKNKIEVRMTSLQLLLRTIYLCEDPASIENILTSCRCLPLLTILNFRKFYAKNLKIGNNFTVSNVSRLVSGPFVFESKRHEEHIKYTLNWCFKYLQNLRNVQDDDEFYTFYFRDVCEKKGLGLDKFIKPTFTKNSVISTRSFKREYINRLMESDAFMKDAREAFEVHFHKNQRQLIQRKIDKIFGKLQAFMSKMGASDDDLEVKIAKFLNIFNLQFPWTILQAIEAQESISKVLFVRCLVANS